MGELLPFLHRARDAGGWTPAERARLEALAETYGGDGGDGGGGGLELVFGASDAGDPWCAVKDSDDEVVVHVARIGDRFLAHFPQDDTLAEGRDLYSTLRAWLKGHEERVVVAFNPATREGQSLLALLLAVMVLEQELQVGRPALAPANILAAPALETGERPDAQPQLQEHSTDAAPAAERVDASPELAEAPPSRVPSSEASGVAAGGPRGDLSAPMEAAPVPQAAAAAPPVAVLEFRGPSGDLLVGGPRGERILGGTGNDTLAGRGGPDTLEGGEGDDRLELTGLTEAAGGQGADTFVVMAPAVLNRPDTLLGVVRDFRSTEGDRLVTGDGRVIMATPDAGMAPSFLPPQVTTEVAETVRVELDLDRNGVADGYVLIRSEMAATAACELGAVVLGTQPVGAAEWIGV